MARGPLGRTTSVIIFVVCAVSLNPFAWQVFAEEKWKSCTDFCKLTGKIPDWFNSFKGIKKCACVEDDSERIIDQFKVSKIVEKLHNLCADAAANNNDNNQPEEEACEACCRGHFGSIDRSAAFTVENPSLCACKPNLEKLFMTGNGVEQADIFMEPEPEADGSDSCDSLGTCSLHLFCQNAGIKCEFCCRKIDKVINWKKSFLGYNECVCQRRF